MNQENTVSVLIRAFEAFDEGLRGLNPIVLAEIRKKLLDHLEPLTSAREALLTGDIGESIQSELLRALDFLSGAIKIFANEEDLQAAYIAALRAARKFCRAQEALFPLCGIFPEVNRYFLEPGRSSVDTDVAKTEHIETGVIHMGESRHPHGRGGYSLFIPETYTHDRDWPLVVALHGGYSHGRDFLWSWVAYARSRGFIVFVPTSQAMTWSITSIEVDERPLVRHLEEVCSLVRIDRSRILLTGMSDGGTFALAMGISGNGSYPAIAPVACALPPVDWAQVKGKRILWVHGAQDWIFPLNWTVQSCRNLHQAGADIKLKVIEDLAHTYPREANATILDWFGIGVTGS